MYTASNPRVAMNISLKFPVGSRLSINQLTISGNNNSSNPTKTADEKSNINKPL